MRSRIVRPRPLFARNASGWKANLLGRGVARVFTKLILPCHGTLALFSIEQVPGVWVIALDQLQGKAPENSPWPVNLPSAHSPVSPNSREPDENDVQLRVPPLFPA